VAVDSVADEQRTPIRIPQAGVSMTEGTIVEWVVADGARVGEGEVLYRLETEKVELDVECPATGVVHVTGQVGETYPVGEEIGYIEGP
jgi:pyruvate/2-oxoglutarate dehydrogenase complex dihydrolipoamide acyltransferase (E2) component